MKTAKQVTIDLGAAKEIDELLQSHLKTVRGMLGTAIQGSQFEQAVKDEMNRVNSLSIYLSKRIEGAV